MRRPSFLQIIHDAEITNSITSDERKTLPISGRPYRSTDVRDLPPVKQGGPHDTGYALCSLFGKGAHKTRLADEAANKKSSDDTSLPQRLEKQDVFHGGLYHVLHDQKCFFFNWCTRKAM